ncbi:uncharacterized protein UMAG_10885 [Mycosarcoma maydis]|uniref:Uncharacterized protein n=1 Tax=Mycosarcoma maydis TaxID=5270 RepID=A0A0D1DTN8_MYCMD|nr:uncharacterized protein UMAG_10885 [Ustilago maydis 521]KIS67639.1 hypothetical protein UMAG_10885 [Ustilago maydis 521]|eukprot:XP_011390791.1 hypothetical protein UMAG_10885 [Ustilago maydis 521]
MCHADQELNASLTQTAVRFASRISDTSTPAERHQQMPTGWVGDTYLLVGRDMLNFDAVAFEKNLDDYKVLCCTKCRSQLGETSTLTGTGADEPNTVRLNKYMLERYPRRAVTWIETLLSSLQYSAASHGSRRFLLRSGTQTEEAVQLWLFSRCLLTSSLTNRWNTLGAQDAHASVRKGSRVFFRTVSTATADQQVTDTIHLPPAVFGWLMQAMHECSASLPNQLAKVLPDWTSAYLVTALPDHDRVS